MKILIISDLHLEFLPDHGKNFFKGPWPDHDVCVIAGDLSSAKHLHKSIQMCVDTFREVVYVAGNHEYYGSSIYEVKESLHGLHIDNFHYLDNGSCVIDGQRFIGGTMWFSQEQDITLKSQINDFKRISDWHRAYSDNESFMKMMSDIQYDDIVVSHHVPSSKSTPIQYRNDPSNCYFVHDVESSIKYYGPKMWIHGHTHTSFSYMIGDTMIVCNPKGYPGENPKFDPNLIIDICK